MTDLLAEEIAPSPPAQSLAVKLGLDFPCEYCGETFLAARFRANHIKHHHPEHWTGPVKAKGGRKQPTERKPQAPRQQAPSPRRPERISIAEEVADVAAGLAEVAALANSPASGAALAFCAPALGAIVDGVIEGTRVDKVVQRWAGKGSRWRGAGDIAFLLGAVFVAERNPALHEPLKNRARRPIKRIAVRSTPILKKQAAEEQKAMSAFADLGAIDPAIAASDDPAGALFDGFFTWVEPAEVAPDAA
jgi:hypothetical protein